MADGLMAFLTVHRQLSGPLRKLRSRFAILQNGRENAKTLEKRCFGLLEGSNRAKPTDCLKITQPAA
jgi:hypothetical protein